LGDLPMLQALILSAASATQTAPTPADQRLGIYVLATIVGVLVCGLISCVKEMRAAKAVQL